MNETSSLSAVRPPAFEYLDEPPSLWGEMLGRLREGGHRSVRTHVLWGAHEPLKGIRDFAKSSRLRLEKFLRLAQENGMRVELALGFPSSKDSFPAWTFGLERRTFVPAGLWDGVTEGFSLTEVPSLHERSLFFAYCAFVEEVMGLVGLYRQPGGPVERLELSFGVYEADLNLVETAEFSEELARRYPDLETFNQHYNTPFKAFASAASKSGIRTLQDKRAWLAAYDYKWCRRRLLERLQREILALPAVQAQRDLFVAPEPFSPAPVLSAWAIALDGVPLQTTSVSDKIYPLAPGGFVHPEPVRAFRLAEFVWEHAVRSGTRVSLLAPEEPLALPVVTLLVVVAGKYLSSASALALQEFARQGGQILFPLEAPQYDEQMRRLDWGPTRERVSLKYERRILLRTPCGKGAVWSANPGFGETDRLWLGIEALVDRLAGELKRP